MARISPDGDSLVVSNRAGNSVTVVDPHSYKVRRVFENCPGATAISILPDSSRAFIACSAGHQVMSIGLARNTGNYAGKGDRMLTLLDVGRSPVDLALKPDGGEIFASNFDSDTISEISTSNNEVGGAYTVGAHPAARHRERG